MTKTTKNIKKLALQSIFFSMDEIRDNLTKVVDETRVEKYSNAMKTLAEAFNIVKNS